MPRDPIGRGRHDATRLAIARRALGPEHRRVKKLEQNLAEVLREISGRAR